MTQEATYNFINRIVNWFQQLWIAFTNSNFFIIADGIIVLAFIAVIVGSTLLIRHIIKHSRLRLPCITLCEINVFNTNIKIDRSNIDIAYRIFIQLSTRKISISLEEDDVIVEVYDSWYSALQIIRELLLQLKPTRKNQDVIYIANKVINIGLRPHLTKWQAKFRRWYAQALENVENKNLSPWSAPDCCAKTRVSKCRLSA